jgi:hypothetical protein
MPFFGQETGPDSVRINGNSQEVMDAEIAAAAGAGLAYWAFCTYGESDPLSNALKLYLSSAHRSDIAFCVISGMESSISYFKEKTEWELRLMREPGYMKVLDGRPLMLVLSSSDDSMARSGGPPRIRERTEYLRSELQKSGHGNPYIVLSEGNPKRAAKLCRELDYDAVGLYATCLGPFGGAPYETLAHTAEAYWDKLATSGMPIVPNIMSGWDTRPRLRNPTPWDKHPAGSIKPTHYYQQATPEEIAQHVANAIQWIDAHPTEAPARTALIYAWDECDEGFGALIPTYRAGNPQGDDTRLKALSEVLKG